MTERREAHARLTERSWTSVLDSVAQGFSRGGVCAVVQGKVIRFDEVRGYGFVAPDTGGDDVFIHVNDLEFDKRHLAVGAVVDFEVEDGDRGLKASKVTLVAPAPVPAMAAAGVGSGGLAASAPAF